MTLRGESSRSVHSGEKDRQFGDAVTTAVFQTSTFRFRDSAEVQGYQEGRLRRDEYGRYGNPTWRAAEQKLADLEGAGDAVLFASGMCAVTTSLLALLDGRSHLILSHECYRRTRQFCEEYLARFGVETTFIDPCDLDSLRGAIRDQTAVFFTEVPTNPHLRVIDLPEAVCIARQRGVRVIVDATFSTPCNFRPLNHGADLVIHSATKYLGGHNDLLAGVVAGPAQTIEQVRKAAGVLGGVTTAQNAYLLLRGLKTLSLRMQRHNENGLRIARMLEAHPKVRRVFYPGLGSHPDHGTASRIMRGFGGVVTFEIDGAFEDAVRFVDTCRIPYIAPSFGGVESLIEMPALMSYWDCDRGRREAFGIPDSLVRLSCGIEDAEDLQEDLEQALDSSVTPRT
ncbi:MAG: aminotransferase class I/II-fold pyridoxal phosphate-dependent enzyme [Acidobacteria bacterium]|nr:aminotransferase class I/II-fold pyridoxal phosphate-dependent enzyme [Acidobacteriota bacterium]